MWFPGDPRRRGPKDGASAFPCGRPAARGPPHRRSAPPTSSLRVPSLESGLGPPVRGHVCWPSGARRWELECLPGWGERKGRTRELALSSDAETDPRGVQTGTVAVTAGLTQLSPPPGCPPASPQSRPGRVARASPPADSAPAASTLLPAPGGGGGGWAWGPDAAPTRRQLERARPDLQTGGGPRGDSRRFINLSAPERSRAAWGGLQAGGGARFEDLYPPRGCWRRQRPPRGRQGPLPKS